MVHPALSKYFPGTGKRTVAVFQSHDAAINISADEKEQIRGNEGAQMSGVCMSSALSWFISLAKKCDAPCLISPVSKKQQPSPSMLKKCKV